jgi:hypothetical protein
MLTVIERQSFLESQPWAANGKVQAGGLDLQSNLQQKGGLGDHRVADRLQDGCAHYPLETAVSEPTDG